MMEDTMTNPICPDCGREMEYTGKQVFEQDVYYCEECSAREDAEYSGDDDYPDDYPDDDDDMSPEEAFHDMRRVDWEREVYRRLDAQDLAEAEQVDYPDDLDDTEMNRLAHELLYPEDFEPKRRDDEWWLMTGEDEDDE